LKPGDLVVVNEQGRRLFPEMRDYGPWEVLKVSPYGVVTVRRRSQRTGRPYDYQIAEIYLDVVRSNAERRRT